jgi:uncharacterized protein (TIGR02145 family)
MNYQKTVKKHKRFYIVGNMKHQYKHINITLIVILFLFLSGAVLSSMSFSIRLPSWDYNAPFVEEVTLKTITVHMGGRHSVAVSECVDTLIIEDINLRVKRMDIRLSSSGCGGAFRGGIILLPDTTETLSLPCAKSYAFNWEKGGINYPAVVDSTGWERFVNIVDSFTVTPSSCMERGNRLGLGFGRVGRHNPFLKRPVSASAQPANVTDTCSIFTDPRDNQAYRTVTIGNQTWMAQNLNFDMDSSWCYDNSPDNCIKYGRLYEWDAAKRACPAGWRLPDNSDWNTLINAAGGRHTAGTKLKSKLEWQVEDGISTHTDNFRFSALPGGFGAPDGSYHFASSYGGWWSATEQDAPPHIRYGYAWYWSMNSHVAGVYSNWYHQDYGRSVRCLQNAH